MTAAGRHAIFDNMRAEIIAVDDHNVILTGDGGVSEFTDPDVLREAVRNLEGLAESIRDHEFNLIVSARAVVDGLVPGYRILAAIYRGNLLELNRLGGLPRIWTERRDGLPNDGVGGT